MKKSNVFYKNQTVHLMQDGKKKATIQIIGSAKNGDLICYHNGLKMHFKPNGQYVYDKSYTIVPIK